MTKHKCNWQLSEDGAAICLECTTIIGADGLIESLQTENTKLQEEIAALRAKVSEQEWGYASVVNRFHDALKHNAALEKVAEAAALLFDNYELNDPWDVLEEALREAGYLGGGE